MRAGALILPVCLSVTCARAQPAPRRFSAASPPTDTTGLVARVAGTYAIRGESLTVTIDTAVIQNYDESRPHVLGGITLLLLAPTADGSWIVWRESPGIALHVRLSPQGAVRFPPFRQVVAIPRGVDPSRVWPALQLLDGDITLQAPDTATDPVYAYLHLPYAVSGDYRPVGLPATASRQPPVLIPGSCAEERAAARGTVLLEFVVDTAGRVDSTSFRVLRATDSVLVSSAALRMASCRFEAARVGRDAIPVRVRQRVRFVGPAVDTTPGGVHAENTVEERPVQVSGSCRMPRFPDYLRDAGTEGRVEVSVVVDTLGRVEPASVRVLRSSDRGFEPPSIATARSCRYRPGRIAGRPVRVEMIIPFNFTINR